jgi:plastocyanin
MSSLGIKAAHCGLRNVSAKDLDGASACVACDDTPKKLSRLTDPVRYQQLIDAAQAYRDGWRSRQKRDRQLTKKNAWIAVVIMPVTIALLLMFAGSSRVTATDQRSAANVAVKIDNFVFGPQAITVPVGTTVTWTNSDDSSYGREHRRRVQVQGDGHGRKILLHVHQGRNVFLLLLGPSENDRPGRDEVSKDSLQRDRYRSLFIRHHY